MNSPYLPEYNPPPPPQKSFAHHAALGSLVAPALVISVIFALSCITASSGPMPKIVPVITGGICLLMMVAGLVMAIVGLCGIGTYGSQGILGKSIGGVLINGLFLFIFITNFVVGYNKGVKSREYTRNLNDTIQDIQANTKSSFNPKTGVTNINMNQLDRLRSQLDNGSQSLSGDDALISKAMSAYLAQLQSAAKRFQAATAELTDAKVLNLDNLSNEQQITARKEVVSKFLAANDSFKDVFARSVDIVRSDLDKMNVSPEKAAAALEGFQSKAAVQIPLVLKIRTCDDQIGTAMQNLLNLLESNWGKWKYDSEAKTIQFEDTAAQNVYGQNLAVIKTARTEQVQAQGQIVNLQ